MVDIGFVNAKDMVSEKSQETDSSPDDSINIDQISDAYYHFLLAEMAIMSNQDDVAIEEYRTAIKFDPVSSYLRLSLARALCKYGLLEEAALHLEEAVVDSPEDINIYMMPIQKLPMGI